MNMNCYGYELFLKRVFNVIVYPDFYISFPVNDLWPEEPDLLYRSNSEFHYYNLDSYREF